MISQPERKKITNKKGQGISEDGHPKDPQGMNSDFQNLSYIEPEKDRLDAEKDQIEWGAEVEPSHDDICPGRTWDQKKYHQCPQEELITLHKKQPPESDMLYGKLKKRINLSSLPRSIIR